jgi:tyrosine-protein kinase Etk/Wzc
VALAILNYQQRDDDMSDLTESSQRRPGNNGTLYLINVVKTLWKRRLFIAIIAVIFGILGVVSSLIHPIYYLAQTIIVPPASDQGYSGMSLGVDLPFDLSSSLFGSMSSDKERAERYALILQSDRLRISVIDSFDLAHRYGFGKKNKPYFIEDVINAFNKKATAAAGKGMVTIFVVDASPMVAAAMANFMVCMLDSINKEIAQTHVGRKKEFLYHRMIENRDSLTLCENRLLDYQKRHGIIDIQKQAEVSVSAIVQTEADILFRELQLSLNESKFSEGTTGIFEQKNDIKALRKKLMNPEIKDSNTLLLSPKKIPDEALTLARLQRTIAVHDILDKYITKAYEEARLEERSTVPTIAVLDPARVPQKRYEPKRKKIILTFLGIGFSIGLLIAVMLDVFEPYKADSTRTI